MMSGHEEQQRAVCRGQAQYALELYLSGFGRDRLPEVTARAGEAAGQMTREGTAVRFLRSIFVRGDEICFFLFDAPSRDAVVEVARRAAITFERVLEVEVAGAEPRLGGAMVESSHPSPSADARVSDGSLNPTMEPRGR
jgi:Nickel responsive protein SCO4226-like